MSGPNQRRRPPQTSSGGSGAGALLGLTALAAVVGGGIYLYNQFSHYTDHNDIVRDIRRRFDVQKLLHSGSESSSGESESESDSGSDSGHRRRRASARARSGSASSSGRERGTNESKKHKKRHRSTDKSGKDRGIDAHEVRSRGILGEAPAMRGGLSTPGKLIVRKEWQALKNIRIAIVVTEGDEDDIALLGHVPTNLPPQVELLIIIYTPVIPALSSFETPPRKRGSSVSSQSSATPRAGDPQTPAQRPDSAASFARTGSEPPDMSSPLRSVSPSPMQQAPSYDPRTPPPAGPTLTRMNRIARSLVARPEFVLHYSVPGGVVPLLRHLHPVLVYLSSTLPSSENSPTTPMEGSAVIVEPQGRKRSTSNAGVRRRTDDEEHVVGGASRMSVDKITGGEEVVKALKGWVGEVVLVLPAGKFTDDAAEDVSSDEDSDSAYRSKKHKSKKKERSRSRGSSAGDRRDAWWESLVGQATMETGKKASAPLGMVEGSYLEEDMYRRLAGDTK